jgi:hypothetical protein
MIGIRIGAWVVFGMACAGVSAATPGGASLSIAGRFE